MSKLKVGIIGCGTIGAALAKTVFSKFPQQAELCFVCDSHPDRISQLQKQLKQKVKALELDDLIHKSDLVIEAASASISARVARLALKKNKQVLIMSVGGLLGAKDIFNIKGNGRLWIPSGAVVGIDGLAGAKEAGIQSVKIVTRKPPAGLRQAPYFQKHPFPDVKGGKEYCVFKGNAAQAVKAFPQNINVAAVLSLAGYGPEKTQVEIWTSAKYQFNRHEITVESGAGKITTVSENVPSPDNPKTSALAIYSAIATLRKIFSSIRIGT